jgi:CMP-2-keto-3-deoxyoctulosonic acid synthetase
VKRIILAAMAAAGVLTALPGTASAVVTGAPDAATAVQQLQADGYHVILNKTGDEPLSQCRVLSVQPGHAVTETVPAGGGDTVAKVVYTPVYVDVGC